MPKKDLVRTFIDIQHVKRSERLFKSARQYFDRFFDHSGRY